MSLAGIHILVTRPAQQADDLRARLEASGARVTALPLIRICPPDSWEKFDAAAARLGDYDWIIFASVNAVEASAQRFAHLELSLPASVKVAAIGPATADSATRHGMKVAYAPEKFVAESLVETFPGYPNLGRVRIFWPKTNIGRTFIAEHLAAAGAQVEIAHCYQTKGPDDRKAAADRICELFAVGLDVVTLTSSETVGSLKLCLDELNAGVPSQTLIAVIGPETAQTARRLLGRADIQAASFTIAGLVEAIQNHFDDTLHK